MKKTIIIIVLGLLSLGNSLSQINYEKFSVIGGMKGYPLIVEENDTISLISVEIGIGLRGGKEFNSKIVTRSFLGGKFKKEIFANWAFATPYLSLEYVNPYNETKGERTLLKAKETHSLLILEGQQVRVIIYSTFYQLVFALLLDLVLIFKIYTLTKVMGYVSLKCPLT